MSDLKICAHGIRHPWACHECDEALAHPDPRVAELEARIEWLEGERRNIVSHATMGALDGVGLSMNDVCVEISKSRNHLYQMGKDQATAELAALKAAGDGLAEVARHAPKCPKGVPLLRKALLDDTPCYCGLDERKAAWEALTNDRSR